VNKHSSSEYHDGWRTCVEKHEAFLTACLQTSGCRNSTLWPARTQTTWAETLFPQAGL